jgi:energy-coupling factor transporter ATP-binding protein EcfA2
MNIPIANNTDVLMRAVDEILSPPKGVHLEGWHTFNKFTGGLRPKEFSIFCGPTGAGKSLWLSSMVARLIQQDQKVFVAPVEIGEIAFMKMVLSAFGKFDFVSGEDPTIESKSALRYALMNFKEKIEQNLVITNYDGRVDVDEMLGVLEMANDIHDADVAVLDNLNFFLKPTSANNQTLEMDETIHKFVQFVKKCPMHVWLVMHPRKTEGGKIVSEFDIKGSSTAVQEATNILFMNRLSKDEIDDLGLSEFDREFVFKKNRKRGNCVNKKFYMGSNNGLGSYTESVRADKSSVSGDSKSPYKKWGGSRKVIGD